MRKDGIYFSQKKNLDDIASIFETGTKIEAQILNVSAVAVLFSKIQKWTLKY